jgi:hypothetical protein
MGRTWGYLLKYVFLPILCISGYFGLSISWYILGIWSMGISIALFTENKILINIFAIDFPLEKTKSEGKMLRHIVVGFVLAIILFVIGFLDRG